MKLTKAALIERILHLTPDASQAKLRRRKAADLAAELRKLERLPVAVFAPPVAQFAPAKVPPPIRPTRPETQPGFVKRAWRMLCDAGAFLLHMAYLWML